MCMGDPRWGGHRRAAHPLGSEAEGHPAADEEEPDPEHTEPGAPQPAGPAGPLVPEGGYGASEGIRAHRSYSP